MFLCRFLTAAGLVLHLVFGCCFGHAHASAAPKAEKKACCHSHAQPAQENDGHSSDIPGHCEDQACVFAAVTGPVLSVDFDLPPLGFLAADIRRPLSPAARFDVPAAKSNSLRRHLVLGVLLI